MDFEDLNDIQNLYEQVIKCINIDDTNYKKRKVENFIKISKFLQMKKTASDKDHILNITEDEKGLIIEKFRILNFDRKNFMDSANKLFSSNPLNYNTIETQLENFILTESDELIKKFTDISINKGKKLKVDKENYSLIKYEKWCNIINTNDHNQIILTTHHEGEYTQKNSMRLYYLIRIKNKQIEIHLNDLNEDLINYELIYRADDKFVYKSDMNKHAKTITYSYEKDYLKPKKILRRTKKTYMNNNNIIKRVEEENSKYEYNYNNNIDYKEISQEWYEITQSNFSYGHKNYTNSKHRKYDEDWWNYENPHEGLKEIKIRRNLDDGLGTKTHESSGYKEVYGIKCYEFNDKTIHDVIKNEYVTTKIGFNELASWNSCIVNNNTSNTNLVENRGKENINGEWNEWYEKWHESPKEKFCRKWGKNKLSEWEEEWKEKNSDQFLEKFCYKKGKSIYELRNWYETWNEKYYKINPDIVEKYCFKSNDYEEMGWGDRLVNDIENKWLHYYHYKNNSGNSLYREYNYTS